MDHLKCFAQDLDSISKLPLDLCNITDSSAKDVNRKRGTVVYEKFNSEDLANRCPKFNVTAESKDAKGLNDKASSPEGQHNALKTNNSGCCQTLVRGDPSLKTNTSYYAIVKPTGIQFFPPKVQSVDQLKNDLEDLRNIYRETYYTECPNFSFVDEYKKQGLPFINACSLMYQARKSNFLGSGAFSNCYKVTLKYEPKALCLKLFKSNMDIEEVLYEAQMLHNISHLEGFPKILGICPISPAILMSYHGKSTIHSWFKKGANFPDGKIILKCMLYICTIVKSLHGAGFIHNDLKTDNINVELNGETPLVTILDAGAVVPIGRLCPKRNYIFTSLNGGISARNNLRHKLVWTWEAASPRADVNSLVILFWGMASLILPEPLVLKTLLTRHFLAPPQMQLDLEDLMEFLGNLLQQYS